jgi:hypothetical protein
LVVALAVTAFLGLSVMMLDTFDRTDSPRFCTLDGMATADGRVYGRDPNQDCKFVDEDGRVLPGQ